MIFKKNNFPVAGTMAKSHKTKQCLSDSKNCLGFCTDLLIFIIKKNTELSGWHNILNKVSALQMWRLYYIYEMYV